MNTDIRIKHMIDERSWKEIVSPEGFTGDVKFMEPMKNHTSLRIGGGADIFVSPKDMVSLKNMLFALKQKNIPFVPIGGGTNILVRDGGIGGVVVSLKNFKRMDTVRKDKDYVSIYIESGLPLQRLVGFARENGYSGIEGLIGIPGSVGGAIAGNAGSFDYEMKDVFISATVMLADGRIDQINAERLGFSYRGSDIPQDSIILSALIELRSGVREEIERKMKDFISEKSQRQPLSALSAGCVFKNPEGATAGRLIDQAGCKGMRIGDAEVSQMHANYFVNRGHATASDFIRLMDEVRERVMETFGIELVPEIKVMGRG